MAKLLLTFFGVTLLISFVYSLSCYDCMGNKDEVCEKSVNCGQSINQNQKAACLKRITKENGVTHVKRGCTFVAAPNYDKALECRPEDVECLSCREDKCNSAPSLGRLPIYTIITIFVSLLFAY